MAAPTLPEEVIIMDILSRLPVKSLMRFRCVSKTWNSLPFDPTFIKLHLQRLLIKKKKHLQRLPRNTHILLTFAEEFFGDEIVVGEGVEGNVGDGEAVAPCPITALLENPSSTLNHCFRRFNHNQCVLGACNGLICLFNSFNVGPKLKEYLVQFWNPATKIMSLNSPPLGIHTSSYEKDSLKVGFGFDDSRDTYKVVAILLDCKSQEMEVRVHCLGDTCWIKILTCPAFHILQKFDGRFASGTLNWLALRTSSSDYEWDAVTIDQLVIFSYDLKDETYKYLLMPDDLSQVPYVEPCLSVLKGCLCLSHDHNETHFIVWLMREFGVDKSWTEYKLPLL